MNMKRTRKAVVAVLLMSLAILYFGCKKVENNSGDVKVTTITPRDITQTTAVCGCDVTVTGNLIVTEAGICWGTESNPTVEDTHISAQWNGLIVRILTDLEPNTKYYVRAYALQGTTYYYGDEKSFITKNDNGGGIIINDCSYVDLDLPSGTLWAECNVGAATPEESGCYFAWGETQPKTIYDLDTYLYISDENTYTKYCTDSNFGPNGFVDNIITLEPGDDAATVIWGDEWRTPTSEDWIELFMNTTSTWTIENGVRGRRFTSKNRSSIFLPAAGRRWDDEFYETGNCGTYWSSSLFTESPNCAWDFNFNSNRYYMDCGGRYLGLTVRPVRSAR